MLLIRYSEIGLKGRRARSEMERLLLSNISLALKKAVISHKFTREQGRIFLVSDNEEGSIAIVRRIFGVKSVSPVTEYGFSSLENLCEIAEREFSPIVAGKVFVVRSRRTGSHQFTSMDVDRLLGERLMKYASGVSLKNPEITVYVEVRERKAFLYSMVFPGPGGLPLGSEGRMVALVSGGIDSPVASWTMMKRGCQVDMVFLSLADPLDTNAFLRQAARLISLYSSGYDPRIHIVNGSRLVTELTSGRFRYPNVAFKRILYLLAERIALDEDAMGIITGESLGQVSSQTPENLMALNLGLKLPVYRPLIGMDKDDIVEISRERGLMPESGLGEFCSLFSSNPALRVTSEQLSSEPIDETLILSLMGNIRTIRGSAIEQYLESNKGEDMRAGDTKEGTVVVDLRKKEKYLGWHYPGSLSVQLRDLDKFSETIDPGSQIVLYCSKGLQSAHAASMLRKKGFNAFYTDEETMRKSV